MKDTWTSRDLPVLNVVVELYEEQLTSTMGIGRLEVAEKTGFSKEEIDRAIRALVEDGYIELYTNTGNDRVLSWAVTGVSARARRVVGQWPSPDELVERIVAALSEAAESETDSEKRSKLRASAQALSSFAKNLLSNVIANAITGAAM